MANAPFTFLLQNLRRRLGAPAEGTSDGQLLERFALHREEAAFAALMHRHGPMVLSGCRRVLPHAQDAEDAFQATFLMLVRKAGFIRKQSSVAGWLYRVAYHLALRTRTGLAARRTPLPRADECRSAPP